MTEEESQHSAQTQKNTPVSAEVVQEVTQERFITDSIAQSEKSGKNKNELFGSIDDESTEPIDWDTVLAPGVTDPSILFTPDLIAQAAAAFKDPIEWARLLQWIANHKLLGFDKRRWQKEVRKAAGSLTVIQGQGTNGNNALNPTNKPTVGAVWPDAPTPTLPLVPGWTYQSAEVGMETDKGYVPVSDPAFVQEWLRDIHDGTVNLTIAHRVGGQWDDLIVSAATLLKSDRVAEMANNGVGIQEPRALGRFLNEHYLMIRRIIPAINGTKLSGVQIINGQRVAVFPSGVWKQSSGQAQTVRLTETGGVSFIHVKPQKGDFTNAHTVMGHIGQIAHPRKTRLLLGWVASSLWADQIRNVFEGRFPVGNVYAIHESGKTTILKRLLAAVIGGDEVGTARDTRFRLTRQMSAATTIPVVLDEFRLNEISPNRLASLYDLLRRNYDGGVDGRGQADQTIRTYRLRVPTLVSGESRIIDTALMDRITAVNLSPEEGKKWPGGTDHLRWLEEHDEENRQCAGWLLQERLDNKTSNEQLRAEVQSLESALKRLPESQGWPERALWGLAVVWFGVRWLKSCQMPITELSKQEWVDTLIEGQQSRRQTSPVDRFVRFLEEAAGNSSKWRNQIIPMAVLERTGELRVGVSASNTGFSLWTKELNLPNLGQDNLEDELTRSGLIIDVKTLKSRLKLGSPVNATVHAYSLNIHTIQERYGIDTQYWTDMLLSHTQILE